MFIKLRFVIIVSSLIVLYGSNFISEVDNELEKVAQVYKEEVKWNNKKNDIEFIKDSEIELMRLIIPKIEFEMEIYDIGSELNSVDFGIELLGSSRIEDNLFFIAGHSGNGTNCYFNRLKDLMIGEYVYLNKKDNMLVYKIVDKYLIVKDGYMGINSGEVDSVYLITCDVYNSNRQLILKGILVN